MSPKPSASQIREINDSIRYAMWSVFKVSSPLPEDRAKVAGRGVGAVRGGRAGGRRRPGVYDVAGLRADADLMVSWRAEDIATSSPPTTGRVRTERYGIVAGLARRGAAPPGRVRQGPHPGVHGRGGAQELISSARSCGRPVPPRGHERRHMLAEHGRMARGYPDVRATPSRSP